MHDHDYKVDEKILCGGVNMHEENNHSTVRNDISFQRECRDQINEIVEWSRHATYTNGCHM
jgi:hypothetical protein